MVSEARRRLTKLGSEFGLEFSWEKNYIKKLYLAT